MSFSDDAIAAYRQSQKSPEDILKEEFYSAAFHHLNRIYGFGFKNRADFVLTFLSAEKVKNPPADHDYGMYSHANAEATASWITDGHQFSADISGWENAGWSLSFKIVISIPADPQDSNAPTKIKVSSRADIGAALVEEQRRLGINNK